MAGDRRGRTELPGFRLATALVGIALATGCTTSKKQATTVPQPTPSTAPTVADEPHPGEPDVVEPAADASSPACDPTEHAELSERASRLELRLLERESQLQYAESRLQTLQLWLDQAIQEVVRTKAKLQGSEGRAEAASTIAEAEIAVRELRDQVGEVQLPELDQAETLLEMGTAAFRSKNYGGALFLTSQAKDQLIRARAEMTALGSRPAPGPSPGGEGDESPFAIPLGLKVSTRTNLRRGPGLQYDILTTLAAGAQIVGYSYVGEWLRVDTHDGTSGWVHQNLITRR